MHLPLDKISADKVMSLSEKFAGLNGMHPDSYVCSFPYYYLTARGNPTVYTDGRNYVVTTRHPHEDATLMFPQLGSGYLTPRLLMTETIPLDKKIIMARHTIHDRLKDGSVLNLKEIGSHDPKDIRLSDVNKFIDITGQYKNPPWKFDLKSVSSTEEKMDWAEPVRIISTQAVSELQGSYFKRIRNEIGPYTEKLGDGFQKAANVTLVSIHDAQAEDLIRAAYHGWQSDRYAQGRKTGPDSAEFYEMIFDTIKRFPHMLDGFVVTRKANSRGHASAVGLAVWDRLEGHTVNALVLMARSSEAGMDRFIVVQACQILRAQGKEFFNLGGSEEESLDNWKRAFMRGALSVNEKELLLDQRPTDRGDTVVEASYVLSPTNISRRGITAYNTLG